MKTKQDIIAWLDANLAPFIRMADEIWANPELAFQEFKASKLQADYLEQEGFRITWDLAGMSTAFVAEWGEGKPIIGYAGEYDALPGLSQKKQPTPEPVEVGGPGHGCGHNLLGTSCVAAAVAVKKWLEATGTSGVVRYYGCPAEEKGGGKVFMVRDGIFDDLDAAFSPHPAFVNMASKGSCLGVNSIRFRFHGRTAHAAGAPHLGRSALDAVELMNVGVNYLREHMVDHARIHYVITDGGKAPNVIPDTAEVYYYIRAHLPAEVAELTDRVRKVAQGAAMMTETTVEEIFEAGSSSQLSNHVLADMQYEAMQLIGPTPFDEADWAFARAMEAAYPPGTRDSVTAGYGVPPGLVTEPLLAAPLPSMDEGKILPGSTDVGDLSWRVPLGSLWVTGSPVAAVGHSWGITAASGAGIGHKGMVYAAKVLAVTTAELFTSPEKLKAARAEFEAATSKHPYVLPIPEGMNPPSHPHPYR